MTKLVVMGVCGCGKSTLASLLAKSFNGAFIEGDQLHPKANIEKMSNGQSLNDDDRWPWLKRVGEALWRESEVKGSAFAACSALKASYREMIIKEAGSDLKFIYLKGEPDLIARRMSLRQEHYMPVSLIDSQFAILEEPTKSANVLSLSIEQTPADLLKQSLKWLETEA
jgi:gluconokinase